MRLRSSHKGTMSLGFTAACAAVMLCLSMPAQAQTATADDGSSSNPPSLQLLGYADSSFLAEWPDVGKSSNGFHLGEFDLLFTSTLGPSWSALAELVLEGEDSNEFKLELERAVLTYSPSDKFALSMGRFHSVISYYNASFPHASWFQVAANRPYTQAFEDEGGLLPSHAVGVSLTSRQGGPLRPRFILEVSNGIGVNNLGTSAATVDVQGSSDQNNHKSITGAVQIRPVRVPGLQVGVAALFDTVGSSSLKDVSERVISGHLVYQDDAWEWITEGYGIQHQLQGAKAADSSGIYTQLARQVRTARPFVRYERRHLAPNDPLHVGDSGTLQGPSVGVRFDPSRFVGIKAQLDWLTGDADQGRKRFVSQISFAF